MGLCTDLVGIFAREKKKMKAVCQDSMEFTTHSHMAECVCVQIYAATAKEVSRITALMLEHVKINK